MQAAKFTAALLLDGEQVALHLHRHSEQLLVRLLELARPRAAEGQRGAGLRNAARLVGALVQQCRPRLLRPVRLLDLPEVDGRLVEEAAICLHLGHEMRDGEARARGPHPGRIDTRSKVHADAAREPCGVASQHLLAVVRRERRRQLARDLALHQDAERLSVGARRVAARDVERGNLPALVAEVVRIGAA